ncbi:unnamed protein product [Malus baccata var. baccata]
MAGLKMFPIVVILVLASCTLATLAHLDDSPAVVECKKHFSVKYAFDVYNYVFKGKKIGDGSCRALVALGRPCHNVFVNSTFTYEHTGNRTVIQARANRLRILTTIMDGLNMFPIVVILLLASCTLATLAHLDDSPAVVECKKHFSVKYAFDVYNYVFKGKKIGDGSCRALVALGKLCHNIFVNNTFTYEHTANRTAIQARADRLHIATLAHLDDLPAVVECKKHFTVKYAFDVCNYVFKRKKIGDCSCRPLVALGRLCHNVFVNNTFTYEHTGNRTTTQARANRE